MHEIVTKRLQDTKKKYEVLYNDRLTKK